MVLLGVVVTLGGMLANWISKPRWFTTRRAVIGLTVLVLVGAVLGTAVNVLFDRAPWEQPTQLSASPTPNPPTVDLLDDPDVEYYWNGRFGFAVPYPRSWRIIESDNADGATITAPGGVAEIVAYGGEDGGSWPDGYSYAHEEGRADLAASGAEIHEDTVTEVRVYSASSVSTTLVWVVTYTQQGRFPGQGLMTTTERYAVLGARHVVLKGSAPVSRFDEYAAEFERLFSCFHLRQEYSK